MYKLRQADTTEGTLFYLAEEVQEWQRQRKEKGLDVAKTTKRGKKLAALETQMSLTHPQGKVRTHRENGTARLPARSGNAAGYDIWA